MSQLRAALDRNVLRPLAALDGAVLGCGAGAAAGALFAAFGF